MPIITKPASIEKNSPAEVSLDKSALAAVASVAASTYYSDSANWKEVFIYYKSSVGNQREVLKFNATVASPVATFLVSEKARDIFQVQKIVIVDFDNGSITVPRSQLTVADFDVDMTPAAAAGIPFQLNELYEVLTPSINPTYLANQTEFLYGSPARALSTTSIGAINSGVANFDITFNLSNFSSSDNGLSTGVQVGLYCTNVPPELADLTLLNNMPFNGSNGNVIGALVYGNYPGIWRKAFSDMSGPFGSQLAHIDPATVIRIKQTGNIIEFYRNGTLFSTVDTSSSTFSCLYMYPFTYGVKHTVESVTVETIPQIESLKIETTGLMFQTLISEQTLTSQKAQSFIPDSNFNLTGVEFFRGNEAPGGGVAGATFYVVLKNSDSSTTLGTSTTITMNGGPQTLRVDFSNIPLQSGTTYVLQLFTNSPGLFGVWVTNGYTGGSYISDGTPTAFDLSFKIYGI